jgi:outer membrane lipase/esterase
MKHRHLAGLAVVAAAILVGCGGNEAHVPGSEAPSGAPSTRGSFSAVVSFGDSLSDVGAYTPATSATGNGAAPYLGGRFTTNSATGSVYVEYLAASLGLVVTPAEVGFAGQSVKCPAAANPALAGTCTGYGQGGARVTDPNGIGKAGGALTVPVKTQIANHLARFGSFKATDLVLVLAGNNDGFVQLGTFGAEAAQIQADAGAGKLTPVQANKALFEAQTKAQAEMKKAGLELAGYVRNEILAKGGRYVAVLLALDPQFTPFGASLPASLRPVVTTLNDTFNLWLREGLAGAPVQLVDPTLLVRDAVANPAKYGFSNVTAVACDAAKIQAITRGAITDGTSLFCNATAGAPFNGLRAGADATTWLFADSVHPTTGGHKAMADFIAAQLKSFGWI